jgi:hypothetical protein
MLSQSKDFCMLKYLVVDTVAFARAVVLATLLLALLSLLSFAAPLTKQVSPGLMTPFSAGRLLSSRSGGPATQIMDSGLPPINGLLSYTEYLNPTDPVFNGADPTDTIDSTQAIQITANNSRFIKLPCGNFRLTTYLGSPLTLTGNNVQFRGSGACTRLRLAASEQNGIVIGNGSTAPTNILFEDLTIWPSQQMTAGCAIVAKGIARAQFNRVNIGTPEDQQADGNWLNNGLCLLGFDLTSYSGGNIVGGTGEAVQLSQSSTFTYGVALYMDPHVFVGNWGGNCIHLGGGASQVTLAHTQESCGGYSVQIDKALYGAANGQLFLDSDFSAENAASGGVNVASGAMAGGVLQCMGCWLAGDGGQCLTVGSGNTMAIKIVAGHIESCSSYGVITADGGTFTVEGGTEIEANGGGILLNGIGTSAQVIIDGDNIGVNTGWGLKLVGSVPASLIVANNTMIGNTSSGSPSAIAGITALSHQIICANNVWSGTNSCGN